MLGETIRWVLAPGLFAGLPLSRLKTAKDRGESLLPRRYIQQWDKEGRGKFSFVSELWVNRSREYLREGHGFRHRVESQGHGTRHHRWNLSLCVDQEQIAHHDKSKTAAKEVYPEDPTGSAGKGSPRSHHGYRGDGIELKERGPTRKTHGSRSQTLASV